MDCLSCVRNCFGYGQGPNFKFNVAKEHVLPSVILDTNRMGNDVVIVKNGHRICGNGAALANAPILQNKAYFEVKVQQSGRQTSVGDLVTPASSSSGVWGIGLATENANLNRIPLGSDTESWVLRHDGTICHNNEVIYRLKEAPTEGDIVAVTYDHVDLKFIINNKNIEYSVTGVKGGDLFPALYVDDGAILDAAFTFFQYEPPSGFDRIMLEKSLL